MLEFNKINLENIHSLNFYTTVYHETSIRLQP